MTNLVDLGTRHVGAQPTAISIVHGDERWTFAELAARAAALADRLVENDVRRADRVCLLADKTPEAIAAMLAIASIGAVYVPLEPASPSPRLARMLRTLAPCHLLAQSRHANLAGECSEILGDCAPRIHWLEHVEAATSATLRVDARPDDVAVILFTSGSTGDPKGVPLTHEGIAHFVEWSNGYFAPSPGDRLSCHPPLCFDASLWDVFRSLSSGAQLHLVPAAASLLPTKLADFIRSSRITQWASVPSMLAAMAARDVLFPEDFPDLRKVIWYGEVFATRALRYWMSRLPHVEFTNTYGPTEASITVSTYRVPAIPRDDDDVLPIGQPVTGKQMLVLDDERRPVPAGVVGDLYVGGAGISPGYWQDPARTAAAFVELEPGSGQRWYFTGDRAAIDRNGVTWFHGRIDRQVKSRGCRIELDEIACALSGVAGLAESAIVAVPAPAFGGVRICAAYAPVPGTERAPSAIRADLVKLLPSYMLPTRWLVVDELPKNRNGKVDHRALEMRFQLDD